MLNILEFDSYEKSIPAILDSIDADQIFQKQDCILLKPNLVNASKFPVTTTPEFVRPIIQYIKQVSTADIIIAEGCGDSVYETTDLYRMLGYEKLAEETGVELMDLNYEPLTKLTDPENPIFKEMYLPEIAFNSFIFSLPVLKAHSLAKITGTLKNMMGFAPPKYYSGSGPWKKASFHSKMQDSVIGLCRYIKPDLTLMDCSVGLAEYHLGGPTCQPPVNKLLVSDDPYDTDRKAAQLLGIDPDTVRHISRSQIRRAS